MKKLVVLFLVSVLSTATMFAGKNEPENPVKKELRTEIVKLLCKSNFDFNKELKTNVDILVNKRGEIVVVSVNTSDNRLIGLVKSRLNYKKVLGNQKEVKIYRLPLTIKQS